MAPGGEFIDHLQRHPPFCAVPLRVREPGLGPAGLNRFGLLKAPFWLVSPRFKSRLRLMAAARLTHQALFFTTPRYGTLRAPRVIHAMERSTMGRCLRYTHLELWVLRPDAVFVAEPVVRENDKFSPGLRCRAVAHEWAGRAGTTKTDASFDADWPDDARGTRRGLQGLVDGEVVDGEPASRRPAERHRLDNRGVSGGGNLASSSPLPYAESPSASIFWLPMLVSGVSSSIPRAASLLPGPAAFVRATAVVKPVSGSMTI